MKLEINHSLELFFSYNGNPSFIFKILYIDDENRIYFNAFKKDTITKIGVTQSYPIDLFKEYFKTKYFFFDDKSKKLYNNRLRKEKIKRLNEYK